MNIEELKKRVVTEVRDYIQTHAERVDAEPLVRMIEIHFSHMTPSEGDIRNMTLEQAGLWALNQWKGAMEVRKERKETFGDGGAPDDPQIRRNH